LLVTVIGTRKPAPRPGRERPEERRIWKTEVH